MAKDKQKVYIAEKKKKSKSMNQNAPPITKHTDITQKSPNLSYQLENIKSLHKKSTKSKKILKNYSNLCSIEKWVLQSIRFKYPKRPHP